MNSAKVYVTSGDHTLEIRVAGFTVVDTEEWFGLKWFVFKKNSSDVARFIASRVAGYVIQKEETNGRTERT